MERLDLMLWWQQYHAVVAPLVGLLLFICLMADSCRKKPTKPVGSYRDRNYLHHQDLVDPEVRRQHLDFNAFLHESFSRERFLEVSGEPGCFVAFSYATCKEVMNDHSCFSSNPFPDERLVALNTMSKADHSRVLRYVHKHYTQDEVQTIKDQVQKVIEAHTEDLSVGKADVVIWAKRIHMSSTLIRLGLDLANYGTEALDEIIALNDAMVALVAPLGGVGPKYETLSWHWWLWVLIGLIRSFLPVLSMAFQLGIPCTWRIIRPDATIFFPPKRPRMGLWWNPELLSLVPRYFLLLHALLVKGDDGLLKGLREGVESGDLALAESLTLMVQLMVNMTSANALCSLVFRLASEKEAFRQVSEDISGTADRFIQEVLRLDAPLQRNPRRYIKAGAKWTGGRMPFEGDQVLLFLGAANMDPAVYKDPQQFRLDRHEEPPPLTFGSGMHYCLGSSLVKLELRLALQHLCRHCQSIELNGDFQRLADVDVGNWGFRRLNVRDRKSVV